MRRSAALAMTMSFVAGAVNASGLLAAGAMTSHMTGNLTRAAEAIALGRPGAADLLRYVLCFFAGAFAATLATSGLARRRYREPVAALLLAEAALLFSVATMGWFAARPLLVTELLCLSMGWQNALITRVSGAVVRTTHMTGVTTDLGIEVAHLLVRGNVREPESPASPPAASDAARAWLHASTLGCFFVGATTAPPLFVRFGYRAMALPAGVLILLVLVHRTLPRRVGAA